MRSNKLYWTLAALLAAGYAWTTFYSVSEDNAFTICLFKNATGLPCASCGITRSVLLLFAGRMEAGLLANPLGIVAALAMLTLPFWIIADVLTQQNTLARSFLWTERKIKTKKAVYIPLVALGLLNWGWNILKEL